MMQRSFVFSMLLILVIGLWVVSNGIHEDRQWAAAFAANHCQPVTRIATQYGAYTVYTSDLESGKWLYPAYAIMRRGGLCTGDTKVWWR